MTDRPATPLPIPADPPPRLLVLFGGTFDPPHRGHVELPVRVRDALEERLGLAGGAWLIYIPAARSPHKDRTPAATDADRIAMLDRALEGVPRAAVWSDEIDRATSENAGEPPQPSYTVDTLRRAREWLDEHAMSGVSLRLLIGADQAVGFDRWRSPREIIQLARPVVMVRGEVADSDDLSRRLRQSRFWKRDDLEHWRDTMVPVGRLDISATKIRAALRERNESELATWLHPDVAAYIREYSLYARPHA